MFTAVALPELSVQVFPQRPRGHQAVLGSLDFIALNGAPGIRVIVRHALCAGTAVFQQGRNKLDICFAQTQITMNKDVEPKSKIACRTGRLRRDTWPQVCLCLQADWGRDVR